MVRVRCSGEVCLVARIAGRWSRRVAVIRVALDALQCRVRSRQRIVCVGRMVKVDACPVGCVVAGIARCWKGSGGVARIGCALPVGLMASEARRGQRCVVVVHMALSARNRRMCAGQWKHRGVIEGGRGPVGRCVAERTVGRESGGSVRWIGGAGEVSLVAAVARRR